MIRTRGALALMAVLVLAAGGCGGMIPIEGTVTLDGAPLDGGTITFVPQEEGKRPSVAQIREGRFRMKTDGEQMGAARGKYKVVISKLRLETHREPNGMVQQVARQLLPPTYSKAEKTVLEYEVAQEDKEVRFELSSRGTAP